MSKERAFVRYTKSGKIVPGSLILTQGSYPSGPGTWKEITTDLCCEENNTTMNYKVYTALLSQEPDTPTTATVLENTMGGNVTVEENTPGLYNGVYKITLPFTFVSEKLWVSITSNSNGGDTLYQYFGPWPHGATGNSITVVSYNSTWNLVGNAMFNVPIEIRVYP